MPITQILLTAATVSQPPTPTYTLTPPANNVNEGSELTFTVGGTNIVNGTYYWNTNGGDLVGFAGEVIITDNSGSFSVTPTADNTTEGSETFTATLRSDSVEGTILATSESITINDTSQTPEPTYTITPAANDVNEGSGLEFVIGGTNITNGTYYWTVDGDGGPFDALNGSFTITDNAGSITVTPTADVFTDGSATFTLSIRSFDIFGTVLATSESITVNDTSQTPTPTYTLTPATNDVDEGSSLTITVGGTNITNGTYYWTIETGAGEFDTNTGEVSVTDNSGTFSVTPTADVTTEGSETFTVALRSGSVSGSILQTSESITINDTSLTPVAPFSLEFNQPQQDFLSVAASSDFNLGNTWTIEFWMSANNGSLSSVRIPGGQWGLINQGGWYGGMPNDNCILVGLGGGKLTINQSANDAIEFAEPTPNGVPSGAVTKISDNQGWDENNVGTNLPTTGGTGVGLTVDIIDGGSFYSNITINTPGSGYTNGDVITVTRPDVSETFTISVPSPVVWTHVAIVNNGGGSAQKVYYNGVEQAKVSGSYTSNGKTNTAADLYIGRLSNQYGGYASHFDGKMAMIRISNVARYTGAFTPTVTYGDDTVPAGSTLTIATNGSGNLDSGYNSTTLVVAYDANILSTFAVGSTITFQDGVVATITEIADYGPTSIDIAWDTPKTGTLFPIILKTANYSAGDTNTKLFLGSDTPLVDLSTSYELNGVAISANGGENIYFAKSAYPNLDNQVQIGDTVVGGTPTTTATVTGAVFTADPDNWGVPVSAIFSALSTANFSGNRHTVTNNGVTTSTSFPQTFIGLAHPYSGGTFGTTYCLDSDPRFAEAATIPIGARIISNIAGFGIRTVTNNLVVSSDRIITYDATGLTGFTSQSDVFNFYW